MSLLHPQQGFIALISILIVSAVLLTTTLGLAQFGIANRFFILSVEQKTSSKKLAEACVQIARIQAYNDPLRTQSTPHTIKIAGGTCTVLTMTPHSGLTTIHTSAQVGEAITNLSVVVDTSDGDFVSFTEVPNF